VKSDSLFSISIPDHFRITHTGSAAVEAAPEISAKEIKAAEKLARKAELAAKKEARLVAKKGGAGAGAGTDENEAAEEGEGETEADKVEGEVANLKI
jgi:hypothetical protein